MHTNMKAFDVGERLTVQRMNELVERVNALQADRSDGTGAVVAAGLIALSTARQVSRRTFLGLSLFRA